MGIFSKMFGKDRSSTGESGMMIVEHQGGGGFAELTEWSGNIYESDIVRSAIWTNAKNAFAHTSPPLSPKALLFD